MLARGEQPSTLATCSLQRNINVQVYVLSKGGHEALRPLVVRYDLFLNL